MPFSFSTGTSVRAYSSPNIGSHENGAGPTSARRGSATLDALARGLRRRSGIDVVLDGKDDFIRTYSTFDRIKGHVALHFEKDTYIGDLIISFEGVAQTYVEKIASASPTAGRTTGKHTFLRMLQPISSESLPEDMLAKANTTYEIPFTFVVPDQLLPYICSHKTEHAEVKKAHLQLPPSMGDPMLSGEGSVLMDDLAPDMAKISYYIKTRVGKANSATGKLSDIEEKLARMRIVPTRAEEPPLSIDGDNKSYCLRKEKNVRKGVFKIGKKSGRLTAEVTQPSSLRQPPLSSTDRKPVTTITSVILRFDPVHYQEQPPQLGNLSAKLRAYTFFGAAAFKTFPEPLKHDHWSTLHGVYPTSVGLSCRNIGSVVWTKHDSEDRKASIASARSDNTVSRRDSNYSSASSDSTNSSVSIPAASSSYDSTLPFYTAKVLVPISLPQSLTADDDETLAGSPTSRNAFKNKKITFVPTFNACVISRTYTLELGLSFGAAKSDGSSANALLASTVTLRTPIQISQEGMAYPPADEETPFDMALIEGTDEYDEAMARHLDQELNFSNPFTGGAVEAIPEYEEIQTTRPTGPARHASIAVPPSGEQPPAYHSPFRTSTGTAAVAGSSWGFPRRVSLRLRS